MNSKDRIEVLAPATVANVSCGFDVMGFALEDPCDRMEVRLRKQPGIVIENRSGVDLPLPWNKNVAGVATEALRQHLNYEGGVEIIFLEKIRPGSGVGSSAASSAAAVWGLNQLLGAPLSSRELVPFAMEGERLASGNAHADNVAPALMGGFVLIRSYTPLDLISVPVPQALRCTVVHPHVEVRTRDARQVLKPNIPMEKAIRQWGNTAALMVGMMQEDYRLIGDALEDVVVEPYRSLLIPGFPEIKKAVKELGALGCGISGSGPSVFIFSKDTDVAEKAGETVARIFREQGIGSEVYQSAIHPEGVRCADEKPA